MATWTALSRAAASWSATVRNAATWTSQDLAPVYFRLLIGEGFVFSIQTNYFLSIGGSDTSPDWNNQTKS